MAGDQILALATCLGFGGHDDDRVLGPVHAGAQDFGHAAVDFDKAVALHTGVDHIDDTTDQCAGVGDKEGSRLHFQMQFASVFLGETFEFASDGLACFL